MSVMGIEAAIGVVQDRNETPHEWDWELAEAAMVAVKEIATLKARVAALEGLGPLINRVQSLSMAYQVESKASEEFCLVVDELKATEQQITAILTGGAP